MRNVTIALIAIFWLWGGTAAYGLELPIGQQSVRIEVAHDAIYEVRWIDLHFAGLPVMNANPQHIHLMHDGEVVRYQWIGDDDDLFEPGEAIRFYGWAFDGSRHDQLFVDKTVLWLWLWVGDDPAERVPDPIVNETEMHPFLWAWQSTVTIEPALLFERTATNWWPYFPNEADAWYWDVLTLDMKATYPITLPHPAQTDVALVEVEVLTPFDVAHTVRTGINGATAVHNWTGTTNVDLFQSITATTLLTTAVNTLTVAVESPGVFDRVFLNGVTVTYDREFYVIDNRLVFQVHHDFETYVHGFPTHELADFTAWDVTDRTRPQPILLTEADMIWDEEDNVARVGRAIAADRSPSTFIVTHETGILRPKLSVYTAVPITPAGGADWVAITHPLFRAEMERLADHREKLGLRPHVVDIDAIINQVGYGYALPAAIQTYLGEAILTWETIPRYAVLGGDATINPLQRPCELCGSNWDAAAISYVPTDMRFINYWAGMVVTDHPYTLVVGGDERPDLSVGRLPAQTAGQMANMVDKIIRYDEAVLADEPWLHQAITVADNEDLAGDFCVSNTAFVQYDMPDSFAWRQFCLDDYMVGQPSTSRAGDALRPDFFEAIAQQPVGIISYRGHGLVDRWAGYMVSASRDGDAWKNENFPTIHFSAACLDTDFALTGVESLAETFLRLGEKRGTVAHLGSTGLDTLFSHEELYRSIADGFTNGYETLGDVVLQAKLTTYDTSNSTWKPTDKLYEMQLLGDPALRVPRSGDVPVPAPIRPVRPRLWLPVVFQ